MEHTPTLSCVHQLQETLFRTETTRLNTVECGPPNNERPQYQNATYTRREIEKTHQQIHVQTKNVDAIHNYWEWTARICTWRQTSMAGSLQTHWQDTTYTHSSRYLTCFAEIPGTKRNQNYTKHYSSWLPKEGKVNHNLHRSTRSWTLQTNSNSIVEGAQCASKPSRPC